jgi:glucose-1-phosphate cytidylyltransferase
VELQSRDLDDWRITFVDTGLHSNIGQRLLRVRKYVEEDEIFLANYSDGLSDLSLTTYVDGFKGRNAIASFIAVRPSQSFHAVKTNADDMVTGLTPVSISDSWVNGGFMCLRREIFDYVKDGEELVEQPFSRLIAEGKLWAPRHRGFWAAMDTFKDKITFDRMEARGNCPWMVWQQRSSV